MAPANTDAPFPEDPRGQPDVEIPETVDPVTEGGPEVTDPYSGRPHDGAGGMAMPPPD
jgi:hypothetical protein